MSVNAALVRFTYPRAQLGRGIGFNALVVAISAALGPTVAAIILAVGTWPYLFAINIPLGIVDVDAGMALLPHIGPAIHAFDWQSAGLSALTFGLGIAAIDSVGHGEALYLWLSEFAVAAAAGLLLVGKPTWPRHYCRWICCGFRSSRCRSHLDCLVCGQMLAFVSLPFYLESHFGYSAVEIGLLITPWPIAVVRGGAGGRLVERYPAGLLGGSAFAVRRGPRHPGDAAGQFLHRRCGWRMALAALALACFKPPTTAP